MHFCKIRGSSKWHRKQTLQYICMKFSGCILLNIVSVCIIYNTFSYIWSVLIWQWKFTIFSNLELDKPELVTFVTRSTGAHHAACEGRILTKFMSGYNYPWPYIYIYAQIVAGDRTQQGPVRSWINNISTVVRRTLAQSWLNLHLIIIIHVRTQQGGGGGGVTVHGYANKLQLRDRTWCRKCAYRQGGPTILNILRT